MLNKKEKEHKDLIEAIKALEVSVSKKTERKAILLRSKRLTPVIAKEIEEINSSINKKNKQLKKAKEKLESFTRV